ncbi:hypothetical protein FKW77_003724 [Venturia effusa]|uniref:Uncharacterized protein n=1 Tax=Venturia effusa TaxID=50376 RepID=A0A517LMN2_9PEZI|nr:hypothetical protein FKW77_003724 [Venturia effusa]
MADNGRSNDSQINPTQVLPLRWLVLTPEAPRAPNWLETCAEQGRLEQKVKELQDDVQKLKRKDKQILAAHLAQFKKEFESRIQEMSNEMSRAKKAEAQLQKELKEARSTSSDIEARVPQVGRELGLASCWADSD